MSQCQIFHVSAMCQVENETILNQLNLIEGTTGILKRSIQLNSHYLMNLKTTMMNRMFQC